MDNFSELDTSDSEHTMSTEPDEIETIADDTGKVRVHLHHNKITYLAPSWKFSIHYQWN